MSKDFRFEVLISDTVNTKDGVTFTVKDQKSLFMTFVHFRIIATARVLFACLGFIQLVIHMLLHSCWIDEVYFILNFF